jgi:outer membrane autotransporter protein
MKCNPRRQLHMELRRRMTSQARVGCKFVSVRFLATFAFFVAMTVSAHAQKDWTGAVSTNWSLAGNWLGGIPTLSTSADIDTVTPRATVVETPGAAARNLTVGASGTGMLTIQAGGTLNDSFATIGNLPAGQGTVTVTGAGSAWSTAGSIVAGGQGTGTLTVEDGGTLSSAGGSIGLSAGSTGTVTVTGAGSIWNNGPSGGLNIGSFGTGTLTIANGGKVVNVTPLNSANIGNGAGSQGTVTVTGAGSSWSNLYGLNIGNFGTGTLTVADGGEVSGAIIIAHNAGSIGTLNIGAGARETAAPGGIIDDQGVAFGAGTGTINFNQSAAGYVFSPVISGNGTVNVLSGTITLTGANIYSGATNVDAGRLRAGAQDTFSPNAAMTVAGGGTLELNGFSQALSSVANAGLVNLGTGTAPGTLLTTASYTGNGGTIAMNSFLAGDESPSDRLVINGGGADGASLLRITDAGGPGAETVANGILVVQAINGGTTASGAFALTGEVRAGAFDYDLFRGGVSGSPDDWFLRSSFVVPPEPPETGTPTHPIVLPEPPIPPVATIPPVPIDPPPSPLPPGIYPIIGPELATDAVVQPLARELGLAVLGTLHQRIGDTLTSIDADDDGQSWTRSSWGRVFGEQIDNRYQSFSNPSVTGRLAGLQAGLDLWRGSLIPGQSDVAGVYFAYGNVATDVDGLVTNAAATGYEQSRTGTVDQQSYSGGGYWTHYGSTNWYLDAVLQGTHYTGTAKTEFASLPTRGNGFIASLEGGYPIPLPLGPHFVLEPQAQIIWQTVTFSSAYDGLGPVAVGTTDGTTGRLGLRGQWTIVTDDGQVWQPYGRVNLWQNWNGNAATTFATTPVPVREAGTQLELAGGFTGTLNKRLSIYGQLGCEFAIANSYGRRQGVLGDAGMRYSW